MKVRIGRVMSMANICGSISSSTGFRFRVCMVSIFSLVFIELICAVKVLVVCPVMRIAVSSMPNSCRKENVIRFIV